MTPSSARLTYRRPVAGDAAAIAMMANHWDLAKWVSRVPHPYTLADAEAYLEALATSDHSVWLMQDKDGPVGVIGFHSALGYWLDPSSWGKGYASEAVQAAVEWHFAQSDEPLVTDYLHGNVASARVLSKAGFREIGASTCSSRAAGENLPSVQMRLTKADWDAKR